MAEIEHVTRGTGRSNRWARAARLGLVALVMLGALGEAKGACDGYLDCVCTDPCQNRTLCCPRDYCRKPLPCPCYPSTCCERDYCRKPLPCACPPVGCCPNDYCRKPLPKICCWPLPVKYRCAP